MHPVSKAKTRSAPQSGDKTQNFHNYKTKKALYSTLMSNRISVDQEKKLKF